jgi:hypothetical protein
MPQCFWLYAAASAQAIGIATLQPIAKRHIKKEWQQKRTPYARSNVTRLTQQRDNRIWVKTVTYDF